MGLTQRHAGGRKGSWASHVRPMGTARCLMLTLEGNARAWSKNGLWAMTASGAAFAPYTSSWPHANMRTWLIT